MKLRMLSAPILALGIGLCMTACSEDLGESTEGERGEVEFSYTTGCWFGCSLDRSLMPDTKNRLSLSDEGDFAGLRVASDSPEVAEFNVVRDCACAKHEGHSASAYGANENDTCAPGYQMSCDNNVEVKAKRSGDAYLELRLPDDSLLDRVLIRVREPQDASFELYDQDSGSYKPATTVTVRLNQQVTVRAIISDVDGREMIIPESITWSVANDEIATLNDWFVFTKELESDQLVTIAPREAGETSLRMKVRELDKSIAVHVMHTED